MSDRNYRSPQVKDAWSLVAAGVVIGLMAAACAVLFEFSGAGPSGDENLGASGWAAAGALTIVAMLADYWLMLGVGRATGLQINTRRLEPKPPVPLLRYLAIFSIATVVAIAALLLFHQFLPILPVRSEILMLTVGGSAAPLEFADLKANRAYWAEKIEQASTAGPWGKSKGEAEERTEIEGEA